MSRCKCCNSMLTDCDLYLKKPDGSPEDMCNDCRIDTTYYENPNTFVKEYAFEAITEVPYSYT